MTAVAPRSDPGAVLLDIAGTLTARAYLESTVICYARQRLPRFVAEHAGEAMLSYLLSLVQARAATGQDPVTLLLRWLDEDREVGLLQDVLGLIWDEVCGEASLQGHIYPDAFDALRRWRAAGVARHVFAAGSAHWQAQFFRDCPQGDVSRLLGRHFDLAVGARTQAASYQAIAAMLKLPPARLCFYSDTPAALAAARSAGLQAVQLVRDGAASDAGFPQIGSFDEVANQPIAYAAH
jgi:enolase-phosphatase E1